MLKKIVRLHRFFLRRRRRPQKGGLPKALLPGGRSPKSRVVRFLGEESENFFDYLAREEGIWREARCLLRSNFFPVPISLPHSQAKHRHPADMPALNFQRGGGEIMVKLDPETCRVRLPGQTLGRREVADALHPAREERRVQRQVGGEV